MGCIKDNIEQEVYNMLGDLRSPGIKAKMIRVNKAFGTTVVRSIKGEAVVSIPQSLINKYDASAPNHRYEDVNFSKSFEDESDIAREVREEREKREKKNLKPLDNIRERIKRLTKRRSDISHKIGLLTSKDVTSKEDIEEKSRLLKKLNRSYTISSTLLNRAQKDLADYSKNIESSKKTSFQVRTHQALLSFFTRDIEAIDLLMNGTKDINDTQEAKRIVRFWKNVGDFNNRTGHMLFTAQEIDSLTQDQKEVFMSWSNQMSNKTEEINRKERELYNNETTNISRYNKRYGNKIKAEEVIRKFQEEKDIDMVERETLDISRTQHPILQFIQNVVVDVQTEAKVNALNWKKKLIKISDPFLKQYGDFSVLLQDNSDGDPSGRFINRYTSKHGSLEENFYAKLYRDEESSDDVKDNLIQEFKIKNGVMLNPLFFEEVMSVPDLQEAFYDKDGKLRVDKSEFPVEDHKKIIKDLVGEEEYTSFISDLKKTVRSYINTRNHYIESGFLNSKDLEIWDNHNNPILQAREFYVGKNFVDIDGKPRVSRPGLAEGPVYREKHLELPVIPRKHPLKLDPSGAIPSVDGVRHLVEDKTKETGFYDKKYAELMKDPVAKAYVDHITDLLKRFYDSMPIEVQRNMKVNSIPWFKKGAMNSLLTGGDNTNFFRGMTEASAALADDIKLTLAGMDGSSTVFDPDTGVFEGTPTTYFASQQTDAINKIVERMKLKYISQQKKLPGYVEGTEIKVPVELRNLFKERAETQLSKHKNTSDLTSVFSVTNSILEHYLSTLKVMPLVTMVDNIIEQGTITDYNNRDDRKVNVNKKWKWYLTSKILGRKFTNKEIKEIEKEEEKLKIPKTDKEKLDFLFKTREKNEEGIYVDKVSNYNSLIEKLGNNKIATRIIAFFYDRFVTITYRPLLSHEKEERDNINKAIANETDEDIKKELYKLHNALGNVVTAEGGVLLLKKFYVFRGLGWNAPAVMTNIGVGNINNIIEGADGRFVRLADVLDSYKTITGSILKYWSRGRFVTDEANLLSKLMYNWDLIMDSSDEMQKSSIDSSKAKKWSRFSPFAWVRDGEYINQGILLRARLKFLTLKNIEGTVESSVWDAFDKKTGKLKEEFRTEENVNTWENMTTDTFLDFTSSMLSKIRKIHGPYDPASGMKIKSNDGFLGAVGSLSMTFKTWLPEVLMTHYGKEQPDLQSGVTIKGRYRSLTKGSGAVQGALLGSLFAGPGVGTAIGALGGAMFGGLAGEEDQNGSVMSDMTEHTKNLFKALVNTATLGSERFNMELNLPDNELDAANVRAVIAQTVILASLLSMAIATKLAFWDEDEPDEDQAFHNLTINTLNSLVNDLTWHGNPKAVPEMGKGLFGPLKILGDFVDWARAHYTYLQGEDEIGASSPHAGQSKLVRQYNKMFLPPMAKSLMSVFTGEVPKGGFESRTARIGQKSVLDDFFEDTSK